MTVIYNDFNFVHRGNLKNGTGNRKHLKQDLDEYFHILGYDTYYYTDV